MHEGESAPKDQLPSRVLSPLPCRLCRELPYGLPGTPLLTKECPTRSNADAPSRWRAIGYSETLYRPLRVWNEKAGGLPRAAPCSVGFDVPRGIPMRPRGTLCSAVSSRRACRLPDYSSLLPAIRLDTGADLVPPTRTRWSSSGRNDYSTGNQRWLGSYPPSIFS
jgi:hypothetical protein